MPDRVRPLTPITESNSTTPRASFFDSGDLQFHTDEPTPPLPPAPAVRAVREASPARSSRTPVQKRPYTSHTYTTKRQSPGSPPSPSTWTLDSFPNLEYSPTVSPSSSTRSRSTAEHAQERAAPVAGRAHGPVRSGSITLSKRKAVSGAGAGAGAGAGTGGAGGSARSGTGTADASDTGTSFPEHSPLAISTNTPSQPTRIPVRTSAIPVPVRAGTGSGSATTPAPKIDTNLSSSLSSTPPRRSYLRSLSALDTHSATPRIPPRQSSADLPPRPMTSTDTRHDTRDTRPRHRSAGFGWSAPVPAERPLSFHGALGGLNPLVAPLTRGSSLRKYAPKMDAVDSALAALSARGSLDLKERSPSVGVAGVRQRRVSFQESSTAPEAEEKRRPSSALGKRNSQRISSFLRHFKAPAPSPLSGTVPLPTANRSHDTFGVHDDVLDHSLVFTPHLHHRRTSEGSIVEVSVSRVLYAENPDRHSTDTEVLDDSHDNQPDVSLSVHPPSLSRSSSDANASNDWSILSPTSPCSTSVHTSVHSFRPESPALLLAVHMLSTHAATLTRYAETMNEISRTMRDMADESLEWSAHLLECGANGPPPDAAMGMVNITPDAPPPLGSERRRHTRHLSLPSLSPPLFHTSPSLASMHSMSALPSPSLPMQPLPSLPSALAQAERLGRDGWANLRAAEEAWTRAMEDLRFVAEEDNASTLRPESTQTVGRRGRSCSPRLSRARSISPHASCPPSPSPMRDTFPSPLSPSPPLSPSVSITAPTPVLPGSRRPSLAAMLAHGVEAEEGYVSENDCVEAANFVRKEPKDTAENPVEADADEAEVNSPVQVHIHVPDELQSVEGPSDPSPSEPGWNITTESVSDDKVNIIIRRDEPEPEASLLTPASQLHPRRSISGWSRRRSVSSGRDEGKEKEDKEPDLTGVAKLHRRLSRRNSARRFVPSRPAPAPPTHVEPMQPVPQPAQEKRRWFSLKWKKEA